MILGPASPAAPMVDVKTASQAVSKAAEEAAKNLFFPRAAARRTVYGLAENESFDQAVLKEPVPLYTINDSALALYRSGQSLSNLLELTGQWLVPVAVGNTNRAMISMLEAEDGTYVGSTFGMVPLAHKWQNIQTWWPADKYSPRLVILPSAQGYYFTVPEIQPPNLTPTAELKTTPPPLGSADRILSTLQKTGRFISISDTGSTNNTKDNNTP